MATRSSSAGAARGVNATAKTPSHSAKQRFATLQVILQVALFAEKLPGSGVQRNVQLAGFAAAAEFLHGHRSFVEMIDGDLLVAEVDAFGHVVGDLRRQPGM